MKTKYIYYILLLALISLDVYPQSTNRNFVLSRTYTNESGTTYLDQVQYFDGLGRPVQAVQKGITPGANPKDLVTLQEYDGFGRDDKTWLPAAIGGNNGAYVDPATIKTGAVSANGNDQKPYSMPVYEASPLNRVLKQFGPGQDWYNADNGNGKAVETAYKTNSTTIAALNCKLYKVTGTNQSPSLSQSGNYATGELYVTEMKDEDGNTSYEFKDKLGQVVLTRQINDGQNYDTYYAYNDFGKQCFVLPPKVQDEGITQAKLDGLAYQYKYDNRNRCIAKKIPGCEWIYYVYDKADRLIFNQDGEQRKDGKNEWTFTIPDAFGRVVLAGICTNTLNYTVDPLGSVEVKAEYPQSGTGAYMGYNITGITLATGYKILSSNYYDNYKYRSLTGFSNTALAYESSGIEAVYLKRYGTDASLYEHKGLLTGTATAILDSSTSTTGYLYSCMYYDNRARLIQAKSNNHMAGGLEKEYIAYNFTGQPTQRKHVHQATGKDTQAEVYAYSYDHAGRLLTTTHQLTDGATVKPLVTLAENSYDDLGRLQTNKKGGRTELNTTYTYNVRSWTTKISSPLFTQNLSYNTLISGVTANAQWNGNISSMSWTVQGDTERKYGFIYDNLSRLKDANYVGAGSYTTNYTYDKHGNMLTLQRYGKKEAGNAATSYGLVDGLTMDHNGNQLTWTGDAGVSVSISESADFKDKSTIRGTIEYTYNKNGALYSDLNKGITEIQYNSLNLPEQMVINSSSVKAKNYYTYSASGVKLKTEQRYDPTLSVAPVGSTTPANDGLSNYYTNRDYVGNIIYETEKKGTAVTNKTRILVDGGYIENGVYYFYQTDHLGNNRVVANASGTAVQKNHYYPFGTAFADKYDDGKNQPYKYNGKELDQMHGLNLYDYSARYYESAIGRFTTVDPLAEKYYSISPYAYCANNPMKFIDPTGEEAWPVIREWDENDAEQFQQYAQAKLKEYADAGKNINCADLALAVLIDYASENGLALSLTNKAGQVFESSSDSYNSVEEFKYGYKEDGKSGLQGGVLPGVQSQDIPSNTFTVDRNDAVIGDMQVMSKPSGHVVIYNSVPRDGNGNETDGGRNRKITYGNMYTNGADGPISYNKHDYTARDQYNTRSGVVKPTYVPNRNVVHRWNVLR
ncbi:MAG: RHS repeat-associated core domain-containing protein [Prevotella sp.]|jgi:RHS repeat-associated protein|nr:RHS repeat-associated core domain-containing protein [Prevotella sp.]